MKAVENFNFNTYINNHHLDNGTYQIAPHLKSSKVTDFFEYLYSYPPKFTVKWDSLDELTQDLLLENNYSVLAHSFPFLDFVEDFFFHSNSQKVETQFYSLKEFSEGYLNKNFSSNFYEKKTKAIQSALAPVPIFVVLNDHKDIVLSKPINLNRAKASISPVKKAAYEVCGAFDPLIESHPKLGFFFLNRLDAEVYLNEVANTDIDGAKIAGLSIHCIGLHSAYRITREHHPGIDFRFVPNYNELKTLLQKKISNAKIIVDDEQQQLRFRPRTTNPLPFLGKLGRWIVPTRSFLQRNEYFKGTPLYIVQIRKDNRNIIAEQYFNCMSQFDSAWARIIQFYDHGVGFGHNWIMQGSLKDAGMSDKYMNYVFFNEADANSFVKKQGRKVARYSGSRTSNIEFIVRKPKIFIHNLEDFLESWEETILAGLNNKTSETIFEAKNTFFVPPKNVVEEVIESSNNQKTSIQNFNQAISLKYRLLKNYIGFLFSVGYA